MNATLRVHFTIYKIQQERIDNLQDIRTRLSKCKNLPIDSFVLLTNFNVHREASRKLQPLKVGPYKKAA